MRSSASRRSRTPRPPSGRAFSTAAIRAASSVSLITGTPLTLAGDDLERAARGAWLTPMAVGWAAAVGLPRLATLSSAVPLRSASIRSIGSPNSARYTPRFSIARWT
jgi:hypothetical protein